jgi:hypothetical protein
MKESRYINTNDCMCQSWSSVKIKRMFGCFATVHRSPARIDTNCHNLLSEAIALRNGKIVSLFTCFGRCTLLSAHNQRKVDATAKRNDILYVCHASAISVRKIENTLVKT